MRDAGEQLQRQLLQWWDNVELVMREHLPIADEKEAYFAVKTFESKAYLVDNFVDKTSAIKGLDALETAVRRLAPFLEDVSYAAGFTMGYFFHSETLSEDEKRRLAGTFYSLAHNQNDLLDGINAARLELDADSPMVKRSTKNLNSEAVQIVDGAIEVWNKHQDRKAPARALNPETPFGRFLRDLLITCGCDADPKAAFRTWTKTYGGKK